MLATDKKAIQLGKCADELRKEIITVCAEFSYMHLVSQEARSLVDKPEPSLLYSYGIQLGQIMSSYLIKPFISSKLTNNLFLAKGMSQDDYDTLFGNSHIHHEACSIIGISINQSILNTENQLRPKVLESFVQALEKYLVRYFVAIKQTPSIFLNFHNMSSGKKLEIKTIAEKLGIELDGDKGILPHLYQHLMRIPLLLKSMHTIAENSPLLKVKEYGPRLCNLHSEISRLLVMINESSTRISKNML